MIGLEGKTKRKRKVEDRIVGKKWRSELGKEKKTDLKKKKKKKRYSLSLEKSTWRDCSQWER